MKKFSLFLILIAFCINAEAQIVRNTPVVVNDSVALVSDTTIVNKTPYSFDYHWQVGVLTYAVDATDATVTIQFANDTTLTDSWITYDRNSVLTLSDATGNKSFLGKVWMTNYMRIITSAGSVTSGEYTINLYKERNR